MTSVIDASAAVFVASSARGFDGLAAHGPLVAPPLMWSEALSVLHQAAWRGATSAQLAANARAAILDAPIERRVPDNLYERAWQLADDLGWAKLYDAEYVALAQILDAPLLTRDGRLHRGAGSIIRVIGPLDL